MIAIVDYGLGNIQAIANIYRTNNTPVRAISSSDDLRSAQKIILPGVGSFDYAMSRLNGSGMRETLDEMVLTKGVPVLGICVGMQMMATRSDEGQQPGLNWISGAVKKFDIKSFTQKTRLPHMGWNTVDSRKHSPLFNGLEQNAKFYFLHSYYYLPEESNTVLAETDYSVKYASSVSRGNIFGVQFHPEKSHGWGVRLLMNFAGM